MEKTPSKAEFYAFYREALKLGVIKRKPCKVCKSEKRIHGHHPDYRFPTKVVWLCGKHHKEEHKRINHSPKVLEKKYEEFRKKGFNCFMRVQGRDKEFMEKFTRGADKLDMSIEDYFNKKWEEA